MPLQLKYPAYYLLSFCQVVSLSLCLLAGCKKDKNNIPDVYVDIYVYTSDPQFSDLNAVGGWVYVTGGSRGIVIYRKGIEEFVSYDRHCTYQPENSCGKVTVDAANVMMTDTCCGSKFMMYDGSVSNGPADRPLKPYTTTWSGDVVHIVN